MNSLILKPSPIYAFGRSAGWLLLSLLFAAGAMLLLPALIFAASGAAIYGAYCFAQVRCIRYEIGDEELKLRTGLVFRRTDHLEWFRVKDYVETQPLLLRMFSLMHLDLLTNDKSNPVLRLHAIPAGDLAALIRERVQSARKNNPVVELE